jgi:hypothetical protein
MPGQISACGTRLAQGLWREMNHLDWKSERQSRRRRSAIERRMPFPRVSLPVGQPKGRALSRPLALLSDEQH